MQCTSSLGKFFSSVILSLGLMSFMVADAQESIDLKHRFDELMFGQKQQVSVALKGHSHNDYEQAIPFYTAYDARMNSIEADLFLRGDSLYVAHDADEIKPGRTLDELYLKPLAAKFRAHAGRPYADSTATLQLMLDLKEDYRELLPVLVQQLRKYIFMLDDTANPHAIRIVISGSMPPPEEFGHYPRWIYFDGRPSIAYSSDQMKRLGMMSEDLRAYTDWNGKGVPKEAEMQAIRAATARARQSGLTFRLWGAPESVNTWIILAKMGVTWLNTDNPAQLRTYLDELASSQFQATRFNEVYTPNYESDGSEVAPRNVILLIGDGMGLGHIQAAMVANKGASHIAQMKYIGFSNTASYSPGNTDSGAGGTAIATGQKTFNGRISVDTLGNKLLAIPAVLAARGIHSGIISTGDAADATPAVFYAHQVDRNATEHILADLAQDSSIDLLVGAMPGSYASKAKRNALSASLQQGGFALVESLSAFEDATQPRIIALLPDTAMRPVKEGRGTILQASLRAAIDKLNGRGKGFFIMAEGAQIDYGGHARDLTYVTTETLDFDQAVGEALRFADSDGHTLVLVTADHETGGLTLLEADAENGVMQGNFATNDHASMMVPIFAYGPGADQFTGFMQNTALFHRIIKLMSK